MNGQKQTRRRAVRLNQQALDLLSQALTETWRKHPESGKLTREEKARLLGVSLGTSERILKNQGVDRPSLTIAFKSVGLLWDDSYCEVAISEPPNAQPVPAVIEVTPHIAIQRRPSWAIPALGVLAALALLIPLFLRDSHTWRSEFNRKLEAADAAYHTAKYDVALVEITKAIDLAKENENAPCLAGALRLAGDLALASGDLLKARRDFLSAILIRESLNQQANLPPILESLGIAETKLGLYDEAQKSLMLCLDGFTKANEPVGVAMAYRSLGTLAHERKRPAVAADYFEQALNALKTAKAPEGSAKPAIAYDIEARNALLLRDRSRFSEAQQVLSNCLDYWSKEKHPRWIATTRFQLATVHQAAGQPAVARPMLLQSRADYSRLGDTAGVRDCDKWLGRIKPSIAGSTAQNLSRNSQESPALMDPSATSKP